MVHVRKAKVLSWMQNTWTLSPLGNLLDATLSKTVYDQHVVHKDSAVIRPTLRALRQGLCHLEAFYCQGFQSRSETVRSRA